MAADAPYPEIKKTHTMIRKGRPWRDYKPPPAAPVWSVIQGFADYWTLVAAVELGLFDALARLGPQPASAAAVARSLGTQAGATATLLDAQVGLGFVEAVGEGYVISEAAERYLTAGGAASMVELIAVANGPHANWPALAETIRTGVPPEPVDDDPVAFYRPLVVATFPTQHRAAGRLAVRIGLARTPGLRVLDLGAGGAPWALAVLLASPRASAVVNDLPGVIELAAEKAAALDLADRVELRPGSYFDITVEPDSYDLVILAHVCRAEGDDGARRLIERAFGALRPGGRVILADYFRGATRTTNPFSARMGATMMASTRRGDTFTGPQVVGWLGAAGFVDVRLHEPIGGQFAYVAVKEEAR
jgi:SAM-dependent methyltransferase